MQFTLMGFSKMKSVWENSLKFPKLNIDWKHPARCFVSGTWKISKAALLKEWGKGGCILNVFFMLKLEIILNIHIIIIYLLYVLFQLYIWHYMWYTLYFSCYFIDIILFHLFLRTLISPVTWFPCFYNFVYNNNYF